MTIVEKERGCEADEVDTATMMRMLDAAGEAADTALLILAADMHGDSFFSPEDVKKTLIRAGLPKEALGPSAHARILAAARNSPSFEVATNHLIIRIDPCLSQRAAEIRRHLGARQERRHAATAPVAQPIAKSPARRAPSGKPARASAKATSASGGSRSSRTAAARPARATDARSTPSTPPPSPAPLLTIPPPPPRDEPQVSFPAAPHQALADALQQPRATLLQATLVLRAHVLAAAQQFQDLTSIASMPGVVSHAYQLETVRRVMRVLRGRALLADEVGLGKTIEALIILREYELRRMVSRTLILAPPALVRQWRSELRDKASIEARTTDDDVFRDDPDAFWQKPGVVVASLALVRSKKHAPVLAAHPWDLVVVDEAHHLKNRRTLAWGLVNDLKSRFLLLLTATPVQTDLEEIYNLVTLLRPGQLTTPAEFRAQYVDPKDPTSPRNHEQLRRLLSEVMVRNTRAQCGLAIPPRFVTTVVVEPSPSERTLYEAILAAVRTQAETGGERLLMSTLLLEAGSSVQAVRATLDRAVSSRKDSAPSRKLLRDLRARASEAVESSKTARLVEIVKSHREPVLIFTRYRETLEQVMGALTAASIDAVAFHGGQAGANKQEALARFQTGACAMVATDVGAEGQNLQFCHLLVNYDLPWNPMLLEQRIGRLHRMGQTQEVVVYNFCARGTIEERVLDVLDRRLHLFELVVGEMDLVLGNLADERDLEERILHLCATSQSEVELSLGFDQIAEELLSARTQYEKSRALDEKLFRRDFET